MHTISPSSISLDDKWTASEGRVLLSGTQAIARLLIAQRDRDRTRGLNTAGYITGYRGSPLGNVDTALWAAARHLQAADITFAPGVNEDLAATAVRGTQQIDYVPKPNVDGVFAAWYGKGPGVDRSLDALKHGNFSGAHRNGGVLVMYGDDHGGKSSTVSHHSEQAIAAAGIPSLYPATVGDIIRFGLLGYAMSRYSGAWVGIKLVNEVAEQTATVDLDQVGAEPVLPPATDLPPEGVHLRAASMIPLREEQIAIEHRLPLVKRFVRANRIDVERFRAESPALGVMAAGKSYNDTRQALYLLGLDDTRAASLGISLYQVGCIWPLEPDGLLEFARGQATLLIVEEKEAFLEPQVAQLLINAEERPRVIGKYDERGGALLPISAPLTALRIAEAIFRQMEAMAISDASVRDRAFDLGISKPDTRVTPIDPIVPRRAPFFCSGCPHSRSTRVPTGSLSMTGIGCHTMVALARPSEALPPTHMGGEGANWFGLSRYTDTPHIFQNMGDGTYFHSGLLAIRAAVAAKVNITYKILYNDAVAMTGGQPIDGPISVAEIAQQVLHEGVGKIVVLSDNPEAHRANRSLPKQVRVGHRDDLDPVQRELRDTPGCTVLIYEQTCAAEKRRRRKRNAFPDPAKRLFIAPSVCEGCGDCSAQSTCVSLAPAPTDLGLKRRIDQASCNKDYSCLDGFCPSFVTVEGVGLRAPPRVTNTEGIFGNLPDVEPASLGPDGFSAIVVGIGGTGVITVAAILGMAAHIDGLAVSLFDMTGLAQKNGAVFSHVRIATSADHIRTQRVGTGEADAILAFDAVAALSDEVRQTIRQGHTKALVNGDVTPTMAFQFNAAAVADEALLLARIRTAVGDGGVTAVNAAQTASNLLGNTIGMNMMLVGMALQKGLLPVTVDAIEQAIKLNGASVQLNLGSFRLGRAMIALPDEVGALLPPPPTKPDQSLDGLIDRRAAHLVAYQGLALAVRYRALIQQVREAELAVDPTSDALTRALANTYVRVLAYKDEYEVARLLTSADLQADIQANFADGARLSFNLAPPLLPGRGRDGRPRKRSFDARFAMRPLKMLTKLKVLRGTKLDVFGYTHERREERALIGHYEALIQTVLSGLDAANLGKAAEIVSLAQMVRGYGPVKDEARQAYFRKLPPYLESFRPAADQDLIPINEAALPAG